MVELPVFPCCNAQIFGDGEAYIMLYRYRSAYDYSNMYCCLWNRFLYLFGFRSPELRVIRKGRAANSEQAWEPGEPVVTHNS
jgi:hypothetical protein